MGGVGGLGGRLGGGGGRLYTVYRLISNHLIFY